MEQGWVGLSLMEAGSSISNIDEAFYWVKKGYEMS